MGWQRFKKIKFKTNDNIITLDDEIIRGEDVAIVVAKKKSGFFNSLKAFNAGKNTNLSKMMGNEDAIIVTNMAKMLTFQNPIIYYASSGNEEVDKENEDFLRNWARYWTFSDKTENYKFKVVSSSELNSKRKNLEANPFAIRFHPKEIVFAPISYCNYDMLTGINAEGASDHRWSKEDELIVGNFGSTISPGGNCAGIAHLTSLLFNTGSAPSSGEYGGISWNLEGDPANVTLTDPYLGDFKTKAFVKNHQDDNGILTDLSVGEEEFVKMIGAYWAETNDHILEAEPTYEKINGVSNYSWELIENMMTVLDHNKCLDAAFRYSDGGGHVVNIVAYKKGIQNPNLVMFKVVDSNLPGGYWGYQPIDNTLYVERIKSTYDNTDTFRYYYKPDKEYDITTSDLDRFLLLVYDENWNILN